MILADRRLYLITGARPDLGAFLAAAVNGGVDVVQLREKTLADRELLLALVEAREVTHRLAVPLVVNDRPDLAALIGADAVHVGQDDLPVREARSFGVPVGLSTHAPEEIDAAEADYLGVGPVHATPTKEGRAAVGLDLVRYAAEHATAAVVRDRRDRPHERRGGRRRRRDAHRGRARDRGRRGSRGCGPRASRGARLLLAAEANPQGEQEPGRRELGLQRRLEPGREHRHPLPDLRPGELRGHPAFHP